MWFLKPRKEIKGKQLNLQIRQLLQNEGLVAVLSCEDSEILANLKPAS